MFKVFMIPAWVLAKVFHPCIGDPVNEDQRAFNKFKAEFAASIHTIPCPASIRKGTKVATEGENAIEEEDTTFNQVSYTTQNSPRSKKREIMRLAEVEIWHLVGSLPHCTCKRHGKQPVHCVSE